MRMRDMDAGELREYVTNRFGKVLSEGGSLEVYDIARGYCHRIAQLTGRTTDTIIAIIAADYRVIPEEQ